MAKDTETLPLELQGGSNLTKVKKDAKKIWDAYAKEEKEIATARARQSERRESLVAMGIPKSAFSATKARHKLDEEKRREHDHGMQVLGEAIGIEIDLFSSAEERGDLNPRSEPKAASEAKLEKAAAKKAPAKKAAAKKAAPKADAKGPKVVKSAKSNGVAKGEGVDLSGKSTPLAGLDKAIAEAEASASGKLN